MLTVYATMDAVGRKEIWRGQPTDTDGIFLETRSAVLLCSTVAKCRTESQVLRALFPRGMKRGEMRKFQIPRLGE